MSNTKPLRILVACEYSGKVRRALAALGHTAVSCDLLPADDPVFTATFPADVTAGMRSRQEVHYKGDLFDLFPYSNAGNWRDNRINHHGFDMVIAFPPCTHLAVSGARWFATKEAADPGIQTRAALFAVDIANLPVERIAIENPVGRLSTLWRKPDQIVQPWMFGDRAFKATCLWLKGLPKLTPTSDLTPPARGTPEYKAWSVIHRAAPSETRWKQRSETFAGIALAMAKQWAGVAY
jgi:hypothetical protein